ncbi:MAG: 3-isopropylmalate dehydratase small subunit [Gammaproteobacteria bacterium]
MEAFTSLTGLVVPIDRPNVDTDAIIPKQFLKSIKRSGFGPNLFDEWRYLDKGGPDKPNEGRPLNPDFVLNQARYAGAQIMLARDNFGCGSSREHAPWAIVDYGIRAIIAPSFADIFYGNSAKNGLLLVILPADVVDRLFAACRHTEGFRLTIDLAAQTVTTPDGECYAFDYNAGLKHRMLHGLDDIGITLQRADAIRAYEARRREEAPWLFVET